MWLAGQLPDVLDVHLLTASLEGCFTVKKKREGRTEVRMDSSKTPTSIVLCPFGFGQLPNANQVQDA